MQNRSVVDLLDQDATRAEVFSAEAAGVYLDYSKQKVTAETMRLLQQLAHRQGLQADIGRLFAGDTVNLTEGRAAMHMALRAPRDAAMQAQGQEVSGAVHEVLDRACDFAERVRNGQWRGARGERICDVVNIGIGGSDLGPRMVCDSLAEADGGPRVHFVANIDGAQLHQVLGQVQPGSTLFIVTSKTFTTQETMTNAGNARRWLVDALGDEAVRSHFVAVSTNADQVRRFGIAPDNMFGFWDWVGGRYSVWSAVGLSAIVALGPPRFRELLAGAHAMDEHFRNTAAEQNLPVILGLIAIWNSNFLGSPTQVVAPYAQRMAYFVDWLQQLEMESNGKCVHRNGAPLATRTTPAIWGDVGSNSQHAFFQMLHQSPEVHPVDFILPLRAAHPYAEQQRMLIANCLAQSAALMRGKSASEVRDELSSKFTGETLESAIPHRVFPGNRPSNTLLLPQLDAYHLGALMALYEHRTYVMSVIWDINAFDQWGVELGKKLTGDVLNAMDGQSVSLDASTRRLLSRARAAC